MLRLLLYITSLGSISEESVAEARYAVVGSWWLDGNGSPGTLVIKLVAGNEITGHVYDQPITGRFDAVARRLIFQRMLNPGDTQPRQEYTGVLTRDAGSSPPRYCLTGTFRALDTPSFGEPGIQYPWFAKATRLRLPAEDLKELQGAWQVSDIVDCKNQAVKLPESTQLQTLHTRLVFQGNQLLENGRVVATLTNDLDIPDLESQKGLKGLRLCLLTLPDGRGIVCSYGLEATGLVIAYPHTTSERRGLTGQIVFLKRPEH